MIKESLRIGSYIRCFPLFLFSFAAITNYPERPKKKEGREKKDGRKKERRKIEEEEEEEEEN